MRGMTICEANHSEGTKATGDGRLEGASDTGADILRHSMVHPLVKQLFQCSPWRSMGMQRSACTPWRSLMLEQTNA